MGKIKEENAKVQTGNKNVTVKKKNTYTSLSLFNIFSGFSVSFRRQNQELEINPNDKKPSRSVEKKVEEKVRKIKSVHRYVNKNYLVSFSKEKKVWKVFCKYGSDIFEISIGTQYLANSREHEYVVLSSESLNKALLLLKTEVANKSKNNYE